MSLPKFFCEPHLLSHLDRSSPILLGLSGGADSSALLHLLCSYRESANCTVFAAHINHGIRGEEYGNEAERDENFCREICQKLGVHLFVIRLDIPEMSKASGRSLETEAREARYEFFAEIMRENNIKILATAHNSDDNLETQLYNLARGCGIDGMIGIPQVRGLDAVDGAVVIRPILKAEKSEIIAFCNENNIPYVTDSTNFENDCTRNIIRNNIIPSLKELFPAVKRSARRLSVAAAEDSDYILNEAYAFLDSCGEKIEVTRLVQLHSAVKKRVIMLAFERSTGARLENVHVSDIIELLSSEKNGASVSLPKKMRAELTDGYLGFKADLKSKEKSEEYCQELELGLNIIKNTPFAVFVGLEKPSEDIGTYALYSQAVIKNENSPLYAKNRASGDTILDGGVNKKIKKLMCDKKVPLNDRDILPILCIDGEAVYVPLCAVSDRAKAKNSAPHIYITIYKKSEEDNDT